MYEFNKNYYQGDAQERHLQQVKERTEAARAAGKEYVRADSALVTLPMLKVPPVHGLHLECDNRHSWIEQ